MKSGIAINHPAVVGTMERLLRVFENFSTSRYSDYGRMEDIAKKNWEDALASQTIFDREDVYLEYEKRTGLTIKR